MFLNKQQLREWVKNERKHLDIGKLSFNLISKLRKHKLYQEAKNIMIFYPLENEVNLLTLMNDKDKNFYLPKIAGRKLLCCPFSIGDDLCESCFKTKEPTSKPIKKDLIDLVIVPALAVDENNHRLGYGGGFYDRFLVNANAKKIVCISKQFIVKSIYPEKTDIPVDLVISA